VAIPQIVKPAPIRVPAKRLRNKPRLVLLSIEDYRKLTARAETRKAGRLETMPDDLFEDVKKAVGAYERDGDET
jgi:hypothetical protein